MSNIYKKRSDRLKELQKTALENEVIICFSQKNGISIMTSFEVYVTVEEYKSILVKKRFENI